MYIYTALRINCEFVPANSRLRQIRYEGTVLYMHKLYLTQLDTALKIIMVQLKYLLEYYPEIKIEFGPVYIEYIPLYDI